MVHLRSSPFEDLADPSYASSDRLGGDGIPYHDRPVWLFQDEAVNEVSNGTDWTLSTCCGTNEIIFLSLTAGYLVAIYFLWNTIVMKPMKLIAVFVHEMGHATACWLTCGSVKGIEVYGNEGGVTKYVGGWRWFIIPAGYVGGSFWGGFFTVMSGNRWASLASACLFCAGMAVSMFFSPNKTMVFLNLGFIILTVGFILIDQFLLDPFLQFLTLFYGVFIGSFSIFDIYDDLITRTVEGSDAHACHKLIPCCLPRCVGVQFMVVALAFQAGALYLALVWMGSV
mmetsp:Transcript_38841/g.87543  ORF Transcript_38841/g.87543 Transcript_38841/m.87543 type:complete len:283 (+) Transcript_38841:71-919(+)